MPFYKLFTLGIILLYIQLPALGQRRCATQDKGNQQLFEKWMAQEVEKRKGQKLSGTTVYTIPVIFHIVHNGESAGSGFNVSATQIYAQLEQLNEDFRRIGNGYNSDSRGGDAYIEFCPAVIDTNGNTLSEPGINRINRNSKSWSAPPYGDCSAGYFDPDYIETTIKPQSIWDPEEYMNIWVLYLDCGILGYAQMPEANAGVVAQLPDMNGIGGNPVSDGVALNFFTLGSVCTPYAGSAPYDLGRTATHEIGHFLGLRHIWGDNYCGNDYCGDTPTHEDYNWGVPSHPKANNCGTTDEMFENYMDYTDDEAMNIFSDDQITRMRVILENSPRRASLVSSGACSATASNPGISFVESCNNNSTTVTEGTGNCGTGNYTTVSYTLRISREPSSDVTVRLGYSGTATYGSDYFLEDTLVTFYSGTDTSHSINIYIKKDALIESGENLTITIQSVSGASAQKDGTRQSVSVSITDDDTAPVAAAGIQQSVDTISGYAAFEFGPFQTIHYRDQGSASVILSLTNTSSHNFGCTRVEVIRSGTGANRAWTANPADYITAKNFRIIPEFNNYTTASYDVTLYYTEAEIAGWESVTGQNRSAIQMIKTSGYIAQIDPPSAPEFGFANYAAFGASGHTYTASYSSGFSTFGMGVYVSLLPVKWVSFDAIPKEDHILLTWKTASESPDTRFEIQRSTDPKNGFENIAFRDGQGSANRVASYTFTDYNAEKNILYYYRILNTDEQGKTEPTEIRSARINLPERTLYSVFPSVFNDAFTVQGDQTGYANRHLQVSDLTGRVLIEEDLSGDWFKKSIPAANLPQGLYIATITENNQVVFTQKILKQ